MLHSGLHSTIIFITGSESLTRVTKTPSRLFVQLKFNNVYKYKFAGKASSFSDDCNLYFWFFHLSHQFNHLLFQTCRIPLQYVERLPILDMRYVWFVHLQSLTLNLLSPTGDVSLSVSSFINHPPFDLTLDHTSILKIAFSSFTHLRDPYLTSYCL